MGKQNSKLKPEVLEDLKANTEFTGAYIANKVKFVVNIKILYLKKDEYRVLLNK